MAASRLSVPRGSLSGKPGSLSPTRALPSLTRGGLSLTRALPSRERGSLSGKRACLSRTRAKTGVSLAPDYGGHGPEQARSGALRSAGCERRTTRTVPSVECYCSEFASTALEAGTERHLMAIIECPECRGKLSTTAANCPHCGARPICKECRGSGTCPKCNGSSSQQLNAFYCYECLASLKCRHCGGTGRRAWA